MDCLSNDGHGYYGASSAQTDPHVDEHGVLINTLGMSDTSSLGRAEAGLARNRTWELLVDPIVGAFDLQHACSVHKYIFGDVYPWAGEIRRVDIFKNETRFLPADQIPLYFGRIAEHLSASGLRGAPIDDLREFAASAGVFLGQLNHAHPFREGNGRTQRELLRLLAHEHGYQIDWSGTSGMSMKAACIEAESDPGCRALGRLILLASSRCVPAGREPRSQGLEP